MCPMKNLIGVHLNNHCISEKQSLMNYVQNQRTNTVFKIQHNVPYIHTHIACNLQSEIAHASTVYAIHYQGIQ